MNSRAKKIFITAFCIGAVFAVAWPLLVRRHETDHAKIFAQFLSISSITNDNQAQAITQQFGPDALAELMGELRRPNSPSERLRAWLFERFPLARKWGVRLPLPERERWALTSRLLTASSNLYEVLPELVRMMDATNIGNNMFVTIPLLKALEPGDTNYIPIFERWLRETNAYASQFAPQLLMKIGPPSAEAVPDLIQALDAPKPSLRLSAAIALWEIDRRTNGLPILQQLLVGDPPERVPLIALIDLYEMDPGNPTNTTNLVTRLATPYARLNLKSLAFYDTHTDVTHEMTLFLQQVVETNHGEIRPTASRALQFLTPAESETKKNKANSVP